MMDFCGEVFYIGFDDIHRHHCRSRADGFRCGLFHQPKSAEGFDGACGLYVRSPFFVRQAFGRPYVVRTTHLSRLYALLHVCEFGFDSAALYKL